MPRSKLPTLLPTLLLALLLPACASGPDNPFGREAAVTDRARSHEVRFEVSCDACAINWSVGPHQGGVQDRALWSHRERVMVLPREHLPARLSATPLPGAGAVSWVRIRVDGEVVAEAREESALGAEAAGLGSLTVEALVPPEAEGRIARRDGDGGR